MSRAKPKRVPGHFNRMSASMSCYSKAGEEIKGGMLLRLYRRRVYRVRSRRATVFGIARNSAKKNETLIVDSQGPAFVRVVTERGTL